jgi:hypothetical protein
MSAEIAHPHTFFKYTDDTAIVGHLKPDSSALTSFEEEAVNAKKTK